MAKNEIAKNINKTVKGIGRTIALDYKAEFKVGQILTAEKAESWTNGGEFIVETTRKYEYFLNCINEVNVHEVNYDLLSEAETEEDEKYAEEYYEALGTDEDSYYEKEVLVPAGTKFEIISVADDSAFEEVGYCEITVKRI
mgnify:FL=1